MIQYASKALSTIYDIQIKKNINAEILLVPNGPPNSALIDENRRYCKRPKQIVDPSTNKVTEKAKFPASIWKLLPCIAWYTVAIAQAKINNFSVFFKRISKKAVSAHHSCLCKLHWLLVWRGIFASE